MEPVPNAEPVFFPLDEQLELLPGRLTPRCQDHLAHLGAWMPFERAAQMLKTLLDVQVSEPTVRRQTKRVGAGYEARQREQVNDSSEPVVLASSCEQQVLSVDGAYIPLLKGEWAEVRTLAIGAVDADTEDTTSDDVHTSELSFFSRMTDAEHFADLAQVELQRRGVSQTPAVCAVVDGAPWIQSFIDLHRPDAIRILDLPHAAEHMGQLVEALRQAGVVLPEQVATRCVNLLKHRGPAGLWRWCERLPQEIKEREGVRTQLEYFRKRLDQMQYPLYRQQGWPIGSGMVESANKVVVQARLKGSGMHWHPTSVNSMLALRTAICNQRWQEAWRESIHQHRHHHRHKREQRATERVQDLFSSVLSLLLRFAPPPQPPPVPHRVTKPAATLPGSSRPSAHHPWKRRFLCHSTTGAKK